MKRHANIPIFIPHLGCPNQCVFCNQRTISGVKEFSASDVIPIIESALATVNDGVETEIAFFGGSFTGIDRELMTELLEIAYGYIKSGRVTAVRCSTRPDYINSEILDILLKYGVKTIELGLQSADGDVLRACKRGHGFKAEKEACRIIVERGFSLVGQMMIGLPESSEESELKTAEFIISSGAEAARIYPTVVFKDTELCGMTERGEYTPLTLDDAIRRSAKVMKLLVNAGVDIIRVGLCASENLSADDTYFAGPNHSALGELVQNELYYSMISDELKKLDLPEHSDIIISVPLGALSKAIGQKRKNKLRLQEEFSSHISFYEDKNLKEYSVRVRLQI